MVQKAAAVALLVRGRARDGVQCGGEDRISRASALVVGVDGMGCDRRSSGGEEGKGGGAQPQLPADCGDGLGWEEEQDLGEEAVGQSLRRRHRAGRRGARTIPEICSSAC